MLQLLYAVIFGEMVMVMSFLFKTPMRKLVIIAMNKVKRGRGPAVVKTVAATLVLMLASSLYTIFNIRYRSLQAPILNPTDQLILSYHILQASLFGFVLFLSVMINRLHRYIREFRALRKTVETAKKQNRSFENNKNNNEVEPKALKEELDAFKSKVKKLESECEALKMQSEGFLLEYDHLLIDNQNLRKLLEGIGHRSSYVDDKMSV